MPRIPYAEKGTEAEDATVVYAQLEAEFGFVPNLLKVLGHSGPATQAMGAVLDNLFHHLSIAPHIREMAYLTVARHNPMHLLCWPSYLLCPASRDDQ